MLWLYGTHLLKTRKRGVSLLHWKETDAIACRYCTYSPQGYVHTCAHVLVLLLGCAVFLRLPASFVAFALCKRSSVAWAWHPTLRAEPVQRAVSQCTVPGRATIMLFELQHCSGCVVATCIFAEFACVHSVHAVSDDDRSDRQHLQCLKVCRRHLRCLQTGFCRSEHFFVLHAMLVAASLDGLMPSS
jgi:hypothetical protein